MSTIKKVITDPVVKKKMVNKATDAINDPAKYLVLPRNQNTNNVNLDNPMLGTLPAFGGWEPNMVTGSGDGGLLGQSY